MILCILLEGALSSARWDAIVERAHACTPLLAVAKHGRLYCGIDDLDGLRRLVHKTHARAALAPDRTSALLCALDGVVGRVDAFANADEVPTSVLLKLPELGLDELDAERLRLFGMRTIRDLSALQERHLRVQFGKVGTTLHTFLTASSEALPYFVPPPDIIVCERFEESQREPGELESALLLCAQCAVDALVPQLCWRIEIGVLDRADHVCAQRGRILREGVTTIGSLLVHARALLRELLAPTRLWWGIRLRLASLTPPRAVQTQMFIPRKTANDVSHTMLSRYSAVIKRVEIIDPWSIIPEHYARITGFTTDPPGNV
ncbi:MAG: hypothetical protein NTX15_02145 [Candidatus Kapabacteria bacterium]|nr:hypothetical protein [Candidatus Kapabacteria bacterium]